VKLSIESSNLYSVKTQNGNYLSESDIIIICVSLIDIFRHRLKAELFTRYNGHLRYAMTSLEVFGTNCSVFFVVE